MKKYLKSHLWFIVVSIYDFFVQIWVNSVEIRVHQNLNKWSSVALPL